MDSHLDSGLVDPVMDAQAIFRAVLDATARPGKVVAPPGLPAAPAPLTAGAAGVCLALAALETPVWLDAPLAAVAAIADFLRFHIGAPVIGEPHLAAFAVAARPEALPPFGAFAQGSEEFPETSATLILQVDDLVEGEGLTLRGPGIKTTTRLHAPGLPVDFVERRRENLAGYPLGVDLILVAGGRIAALPRTTEVEG